MVNFKKLGSSFGFASSGLKDIFKEENAFRLEIIIALLVITASFLLDIHFLEKVAVFLTIFLVLGMELINSLFERICNLISPDLDDKIRKIKDVSSAMVLISYIFASAVGIIIFLPYIIDKMEV